MKKVKIREENERLVLVAREYEVEVDDDFDETAIEVPIWRRPDHSLAADKEGIKWRIEDPGKLSATGIYRLI